MMDRYLLSKRANSVIRAALIAVVLIAGAEHLSHAWAQSAELDAAFEKYEELKKQGKFAEAIPYAQKCRTGVGEGRLAGPAGRRNRR
jgi:hypothetical protein